MDSHWGTPLHRKRKRRRGPDKPAISAQLLLDGQLKGDIGALSEDLFNDLFPALGARQDSESSSDICHVALTPRVPLSLFNVDSAPWTILAVRRFASESSEKQDARSTIHFPAASTALQSFLDQLQKHSANPSRLPSHANIDVYVLDAVPIALETIFVSVDEVALEKLEEAHRKFHQGHAPFGRRPSSRSGEARGLSGKTRSRSNSGSNKADNLEDYHLNAIREALSTPKVVHTRDALPLPLPSHPITHVSPPPAVVEFCEPVSQGRVVPHTRIVVVSSGSRAKHTPTVSSPPSSYPFTNGIVEEEEDTSNEQFFSAVEEPGSSPALKKHAASASRNVDLSDAETSNDEDTDLSDGEGDTIGLSLPGLPAQSSGVLSAMSSATPRPGQLFNHGIATPGSVISTLSTSTVLGGGSRGRLFEVHGLLSQIPNEALQPRPQRDEDEEARVFVDTAALVKLGCFSGDWVRLEAVPEGEFGALGSWGKGLTHTGDNVPQEWRVAKIFSLPGQSGRKPRYAIDKTGHRRLSQSLLGFEKAALKAHVSPLLLNNLGNPTNLRIASLAPPYSRSGRAAPSKNRITSMSSPPDAKEVSLIKFTTPMATERNLNASLFTGLRKYFEQKRRIVKAGDLIGIPIDANLGRAIFKGSTTEEDAEQEEMLGGSVDNNAIRDESNKFNVAWFKVGSVTLEPQNNVDEAEENPWGPIAVVKPHVTRMSQSSTEQGRLPTTSNSTWPYYMGCKRLPSSNNPSEQALEAPRPYITNTRRRLRELLSAATSPQAVHLGLPPVAILLVSTQRHIGKATLAKNACSDLGMHTFVIDAYDVLSEGGGGGGDKNTAGLLEARSERAWTCGPEYTALLIQHIDVLTADRMSSSLRQIQSESRVIIATTTDIENVPEGVRSLFTHEIEMHAPDEGEREGLLRDIIQDSGIPLSSDVDLSSVAIKTAALVAGDLVDVVDRATVARRDRLEKLADVSNEQLSKDDPQVTVQDVQLAGGDSSRCVIKADFDVAVDAARKNFADAIGAPKIPNVGWDDVGGLNNVKDSVMETIQLPLERPELFAKGMKKRSGILFYGPPGTGKTLLAKAIATEFSLNFFSVKGPELLNMYIGESEANVRRVFQRARDARPCVVFFDELDSVAPKRGNQGDSGGVMDRIVSQLLAELDGMSSGDDSSGGGSGVFVIGATNRPDLLDQALLRPGRFDKMLYLGVSDTHEKQLKILEALTRKFTLHPSLSLPHVSSLLPFTYTGADLYALCSDAMLKAITRRASSVDTKIKFINARRTHSEPQSPSSKQPKQNPITTAYFFDHLASEEDTSVVVETTDFEAAMRELVPSVSVKELEHYERVRWVFEQGEKAKDKPRDKSTNSASASVSGDRPQSSGSAASSFSGGDRPALRRVSGMDLRREKDVKKRFSARELEMREVLGGEPEPDDDDFVAKTGALSLDDEVDRPVMGNFGSGTSSGGANGSAIKGRKDIKGKGKAKASPLDDDGFGFGDSTEGDEEGLYG